MISSRMLKHECMALVSGKDDATNLIEPTDNWSDMADLDKWQYFTSKLKQMGGNCFFSSLT